MSDRIYKGKLAIPDLIRLQNVSAFPEAAEAFDTMHKGGLVPFEVLRDILKADFKETHFMVNEIWIQGPNSAVRVQRDGTIEIVG